MKKKVCFLAVGLLAICLAACGTYPSTAPAENASSPEETAMQAETEELLEEEVPSSAGESDPSLAEEDTTAQQESEEETVMEQNVLYVTVGETTFTATFADNSGARALQELLAGGAITIRMSDYGGFEKVGSLGQSLPTENRQVTTQAGDIVLYQGNQIVIFYGSNSWSYTPLGKVDDLTGWEEALENGTVSVTFSLQE